jgi:hypothetical protein
MKVIAGNTVMRNPSPVEDDAFLHAEARELAVLAQECVDRHAADRRPASVLHTLGVELSVLMGLGDGRRMDWLVAETSRLLSNEGKQEAISALQAALGRLQRASMPGSLR